MHIIKFMMLVYSWAGICVLLLFLVRIAYFYEKTSGQATGYHFLAVPTLLLTGGVVIYLIRGLEFTGYPAGDLLLSAGGVALILFGARLQEFMTGERR
jgi:hypothetical protein